MSSLGKKPRARFSAPDIEKIIADEFVNVIKANARQNGRSCALLSTASDGWHSLRLISDTTYAHRSKASMNRLLSRSTFPNAGPIGLQFDVTN